MTARRVRDEKKEPGTWEHIQKTFFEDIDVRTSKGIERVSRLSAYMKQLGRSSVLGETAATGELLFLRKFSENHGINIGKPHQLPEDLDDRQKTHIGLSEVLRMMRGKLFLCMEGDFKACLEKMFGPLEGFDELWIEHAKYEPLPPAFRALCSADHDDRPQSGYGRPPVHTRWQKNQSGNPSGRRKRRDYVCDEVEENLLGTVVITRAGRRARAKAISVACIQLLAKAGQGNGRAIRLVRRIIVELHERGLLVPPPAKPRRKKYSVEEEAFYKREYYKRIWPAYRNVAKMVKSDMMDMYRAAYGDFPEPKTYCEKKIDIFIKNQKKKYGKLDGPLLRYPGSET